MKIENILLLVGGALGLYFLFKDKIDSGVQDFAGIFDADRILTDQPSIITPLPNIFIDKAKDIENFSGIPISQAIGNTFTASKLNVNDAVKEATQGTGTYKPYKGLLEVQNQGYSVRAESASAMAKQVYVKPKTNIKSIQPIYSKVNINPYSKLSAK